MNWRGKIYIDSVLPFGLRSAPKIFSSVADALEWILLQHGVSLSLHYLDDFLTAGAANSSQCRDNLDLIIAICEWLGIPLKREKIDGPLTLLGIELDTSCSELRLPAEKICQLLDIIIGVMEGEEALSEEGATLIDWKVVACVQGSSGWQDLLEEDDRDRQDSPPAKSLGTRQR